MQDNSHCSKADAVDTQTISSSAVSMRRLVVPTSHYATTTMPIDCIPTTRHSVHDFVWNQAKPHTTATQPMCKGLY